MPADRLAGDALRFLIAGGLNTVLTSLVYFVGLAFVPSSAAYAIAWLAGLAFVMAFYPDRVFPGGRTAMADRLAMGASVLVVFLVGLGCLHLLSGALQSATAAFFITLTLTTLLNFAFSRWLVRRA